MYCVEKYVSFRVRLQLLTAESMKMRAFWDIHHPDDTGNMHL
jgi:hypothetical protein